MESDSCLRYKQNCKFKCAPCQFYFQSKDSFLDHLNDISHEITHSDQNHICESCSLVSLSKTELVYHLESNFLHLSSIHNCACQGNSKRLGRLLRHGEALSDRCLSHDVYDQVALKHVGRSPLHCAARNGFQLCVIKLLKWGADPNLRDEFGFTPVHYAMCKGDVRIITTMIRNGGNVFLVDNSNQTAFNYASEETKWAVLNKIFIFQDRVKTPTAIRNFELFSKVAEHFQDHMKGLGMIAAPAAIVKEVEGNLVEHSQATESAAPETVDTAAVAKDTERALTEAVNHLVDLKVTREIYQHILDHGKERVAHSNLLVLGHVAAGKSSLVRTLSGKEFTAERHETDGIDSSFVQTVNANDSWQEVCDATGWKYHEAVAKNLVRRLLEMVNDDAMSNLTESFSQNLSLTDANDQGVKDVVPNRRREQSIEVPIKEHIVKNLKDPQSVLSDVEFKISIWDFAGHALYQTMHHIFLNAKAMYLICFDLQEHVKDPENSLRYLKFWLNSVAAHKACQPAIFLIATHVDSLPAEKLEDASNAIKARLFDNFMNYLVLNEEELFFPIENSKGPDDERARVLKCAIRREALTTCDDEMQIKWLRCEKLILEIIFHESEVFSLTKYQLQLKLEQLCEQFDPIEYQEMLKELHNCGVIWLPELLVSNPVSIGTIADMVIINIQHLMDAMKVVCKLAREDTTKVERVHRSAAKVLQTSGKISHKDLKSVLKNVSAPVDQVIDLLIIFNILLPAERIKLMDDGQNDIELNDEPKMTPFQTSTPKAKHTKDNEPTKEYIIPSLLKESNLEQTWTQYRGPYNVDVFLIDFFGFMPDALFHQLLVQISLASCDSGSFDSVISKWDGIFGLDEEIFRLVYDPSNCLVIGQVRCRERPHGNLLVKMKRILRGVCENFFRFQKFRVMLPCLLDSCQFGEDTKRLTIADVEREYHLIEYNPEEPRPVYCGPNKLELARWGLEREAKRSRGYSDASDGSIRTLSQSISVDSGMSESHSPKDLVADNIGPFWPKLARELNWSPERHIDSIIETIQADYPKGQQNQAYEMLKLWQRDRGNEATIACLQRALNNCGRRDIANRIQGFDTL